MILPGGMLGVLGGGQLGLMFSLAARRMGYRTLVVDPDPDAPAFAVCDRRIVGPYSDPDVLSEVAHACQAVTTEFENVPAASLAFLEKSHVVRPSSRSVATCQDRILEKTFLRDQGFETAPFAVLLDGRLPSPDQLSPLLPGILKSSREGYDGKGQWGIRSHEELSRFLKGRTGSYVLEKKLDLVGEFSVVLARGADGETALYPVAENLHASGILHVSAVPAGIPGPLSDRMSAVARSIALSLDYKGVLSVEFFLAEGDRLYVNELAPRPHNSGHYTIDACVASQFDQQVRVLAGLPLASTRLLSPCAMGNLLGSLWQDHLPPPLGNLLEHPSAKLYLYGKKNPRPGRKMGHFTVIAESAAEASLKAHTLLAALSPASLSQDLGEEPPVP